MNMAKKIGMIVGIIAIGLIVPIALYAGRTLKSETNVPSPQDYLKNQAQMMTDGGTMMQNMSNMMMEDGQMMQQKGSEYNDSEMMQKGKDLSSSAQKMQTEGKNLMNSGTDFTSKIK